MGSGYKGGKTDEIVMRMMDGLMSFPSLLMALLILTSLGANAVNVVLTISIVFVAPVSRVMRSITLSLKTLEFVQSARMRGEPQAYIIFREILPNAIPVLVVEATVRLSYAILLASSLGFLGLGVQPPSPDWGLMLSESRKFIADSPWVALAPAFAIASLVVGVNLLTDGIKQARQLPKDRVK
jgi:peptide/nickel transport system permease protein